MNMRILEFVRLLLFGLVGIALFLTLNSCSSRTQLEPLAPQTDAYFNRCAYNYIDPETGVNYIIIRDSSPDLAMSVRYNSDGTIMVTDVKHEYV